MMWRALMLLVLVPVFSAGADPSPDAAQLYRDGEIAFDQAHYDDALVAWQRSYDLSHAPKLFYNLAQAHRLRARPGDCARARAQYQSFVQLVAEPSPHVDGDEWSWANKYIAQLATCASPPSGDSTTHDQSLRNRQIAVVAIGAGGLALLATGMYLGHHASILGDEVTSECANSCDWAQWSPKDAAGRRDSTLGWTFDTLGVVALAGSAALYWFGVHDAELQVAPVATRSHESGAVVTWSRSW